MTRYFRVIVLPILAATIFSLGVVYAGEKSMKDERRAALASGIKAAPDFSLPDLKGKKVKLSDFRGKVVILDFFATWCPPCRAEIPHFVALYKQHKDRGLVIIGVSLDQGGVRVVESFVKKYGINYTILMEDQKVVKNYGGIRGIPTTFVIDKQGGIYKKYVGYRDKSVFEKDIQELISHR